MHAVLIADDHDPTRQDVAAAVDADDRFAVVACAADAPQAVQQALAHRPAVCLLDVRMPGSGIAAVWEITARLPTTKVVMLSVTAEDGDLFPALRAGAHGYLLKDLDLRSLPDELWAVLHGGAAMPGPLMARVLDSVRERHPRRRAAAHPGPCGATLTSREWEVLGLLREGRTTAEVARALQVSAVTVRTHVSALVRKTGAAGRDDLLELDPGR